MPVKAVIKAKGFTAAEVKPHVDHKTLKIQFTKIEKSAKEWIETAVTNLLGTATTTDKKKTLKSLVKGGFTITSLPTAGGSDTIQVFVGSDAAGTITATFEAPAEKEVVLATPKVSYENNKVETACSGLLDKIHSIFHAGTGYKGHGAVALLGGANHSHVTNQDGIAFKWKGDTLHVVSYGRKNDKAPQGSCGYDWIR